MLSSCAGCGVPVVAAGFVVADVAEGVVLTWACTANPVVIKATTAADLKRDAWCPNIVHESSGTRSTLALHRSMEHTACPNCAQAMQATDQYCAQCGQAAVGDGTFRSFVEQFLGDYFTFDSKIIRSIRPLLFSPGFLTAEYLAGRRARYIPPLRMFIFLSVFFFLMIGWSNAGEDGGTALEALPDQLFWDRFFTDTLPKLFFLFLPLFAFWVMLVYRQRDKGYLKPFLFSAHFHAFVFLWFTLYGVLSASFRSIGAVQVNQVLIVLFLGYTAWYLWRGLELLYPGKFVGHLVRYVGLALLYVASLVLASIGVLWIMA